jgi:hypothetical protein
MKRASISLIASTALLLVACGDQNTPAPTSTSTNPAPTQAAAQGVGKVLDQAAKGNPIPRDGVPDFVETMPNGSFLTASKFSNELKSGGSLMYALAQDRASVIAFYKASFQKNGLQLVSETEAEKRGKMESALKASADDGRTLDVFVVQRDRDVVIQANFTVPATK